MRPTTLLLLLTLGLSSFGQIKLTKLDSTSLPATLQYTGHISKAVKWKDSMGIHYVITSVTDRVKSSSKEEEDGSDAYLYACHYIIKNDSSKLLWRIYDYNKACPLDMELYFVDKAFTVTDLDKNGIAEVWVMYKNSCQGDVSPVPAKIIMYEGSKKYALRGESRVKVSATEYMGGRFSLDDNFKNGNILFRQYAEKLWAKNKIETWNQ